MKPNLLRVNKLKLIFNNYFFTELNIFVEEIISPNTTY